jgi:hypothetical protein
MMGAHVWKLESLRINTIALIAIRNIVDNRHDGIHPLPAESSNSATLNPISKRTPDERKDVKDPITSSTSSTTP